MIGQQLGPYQIETELGSGGMGRVYLARNGQRVAIKVLHPHLLASDDAQRRFRREAELGMRVHHPNVVRALEVGSAELNGVLHHYLVMEYVQGQTLSGLTEELGTVPERLCRHIGREIAKGLTAIHEVGAVHRDLKPANVLITPDHQVKIMDLGLAHLVEASIQLTSIDNFLGSVKYAAPEQFQGLTVDWRADYYAEGLILYELATGQHPSLADDFAGIINLRISETPQPAGEVNPQLSPFFEAVLQALLQIDREERLSSIHTIFEQGEQGKWWQQRALEIRQKSKRPLRRIRVPHETALYGRDSELAWMRSAFDRAKAGNGQVLLIDGEAGIGKTRLVDEFVGLLEREGEDLNFLFGSYPPGGAATAAGAFSTAYREQFGPEGSKAYLSETPTLVPAFDALLRGELPPEGQQALTEDTLQTVFVHATRSLAAERPTIVLIEDLHFAPDEGRGVFASLAMAAPGHRFLLVGTMRLGVPEAWIFGVTRLEHADHRTLSRLGAEDLSSLLEESFQSKELVEELGHKIALKSDGNPFFAFEILRGLKEGQLIAQVEDGSWVATDVIEDIAVPSSVLDHVKARVAALTEEERELLDVASCWGYEFDPVFVAEVAGVARVPALKCFGLIERQHRLVHSTGDRLVFDHHQVQEALYEAILEPLREEYHAAIAATLEKRSEAAEREPKELDGALCVALCVQFLKGGRGRQAARYLKAALEHLAAGYLNAPAIDLADRALEVPGLLEGKARIEVLLRKSSCLDMLGRPDEQRGAIDEATALANETGDGRLQGQAQRSLGELLYALSEHDAAQAALRESLKLARAASDKRLEVRATGTLSNVLLALGRLAEAQEHYERVRALSREIGDSRSEANATCNLGNVFLALARYAEAQEHFERARAIYREIGDRRGEILVSGNLGIVYQNLGRYAEAQEYQERARVLAREIGDRRNETLVTSNLGMVFSDLGRYAEAQQHQERARALARDIGDRRGEAKAICNLGLVCQNLGRYSEAQEHQANARAIYREIGDSRSEANAICNLGSVFFALARYAEAQEHFERARAIYREIGDRRGETLVTSNLGMVFSDLGRYAEAQEHQERARALARDIGDRRSAQANATCNLGLVCQNLGRYAEAQEHFERARAIYREVGDRQGEAIATGDLGLVFFALGRLAKSQEQHEKQRSLSRELGDRSIEGRALDNLARLSEAAGDVETATQLCNKSLALHRELGEMGLVAARLVSVGRLAGAKNEMAAAWTHLDEALTLARETKRPGLILAATVEQARLPDGDATAALATLKQHEQRVPLEVRLEARFHLWQQTTDEGHLTEAKRLLDFAVEHSPEEYRTSMLKNVPLHRDIMKAWEEQGGEE